MPENQAAWNSDNQGIKETVNQTNQTGKMGRQMEGTRGKAADCAGRAGCCEMVHHVGRAGWMGNWDSELTVDYGGGELHQLEKLPVSYEGSLESALEPSR